MQNYGKTDIGRVRVTNQDSYRTDILPGGGTVLAVVCDGMGGANAGNIASAEAVNSIWEYCRSSYRTDMDSGALTECCPARFVRQI